MCWYLVNGNGLRHDSRHPCLRSRGVYSSANSTSQRRQPFFVFVYLFVLLTSIMVYKTPCIGPIKLSLTDPSVPTRDSSSVDTFLVLLFICTFTGLHPWTNRKLPLSFIQFTQISDPLTPRVDVEIGLVHRTRGSDGCRGYITITVLIDSIMCHGLFNLVGICKNTPLVLFTSCLPNKPT